MILVPPTAVRVADPDSSGAALQPIAPLLRDASLTEIMQTPIYAPESQLAVGVSVRRARAFG